MHTPSTKKEERPEAGRCPAMNWLQWLLWRLFLWGEKRHVRKLIRREKERSSANSLPAAGSETVTARPSWRTRFRLFCWIVIAVFVIFVLSYWAITGEWFGVTF
jgi:hypothetical protein